MGGSVSKASMSVVRNETISTTASLSDSGTEFYLCSFNFTYFLQILPKFYLFYSIFFTLGGLGVEGVAFGGKERDHFDHRLLERQRY